MNNVISGDVEIDEDLGRLKFVSKEGYYTNGFGKVGRLRDVLIWKTQKDTIYTFSIYDEEISARVVFLEDFVTIGWGKYATINQSIGGWAEDDALYCLKESYDIESDWFTIHYLAHEGKHFSDYKIFPKLSGYDLEYRAKLTELSLAQETVHPLIGQFVSVANYESENYSEEVNGTPDELNGPVPDTMHGAADVDNM